MQPKEEPVDSLNFFTGTLFITDMPVSVLQPNTTFYLLKRWGSILGVLIYRRKSHVCNHYTSKSVQRESWKKSCSI